MPASAAPVAVRTAQPEDAEAIGAMMHEFAAYLRSLGDDGKERQAALLVALAGDRQRADLATLARHVTAVERQRL